MRNSGLILLDGHLLGVFAVVAEELHYGRAAARLFVSQSALSQQVKRLEEKVGATLFIRTTRSVALTPAGKVMYRHLRKISADSENMLRQVRRAARGEMGYLSVGITPTAACSSLADVLHTYRTGHPEIELDLHELNSIDMAPALRLKTIDVAFMRPVGIDADISMEEAYTEPMLVALRMDDPLAQHDELTLAQISQRDFVGYRREISPYFQRLFNQLFLEAGIVPNVVQESIIPTLLTLVEAGVGVAIIPASLARMRGEFLRHVPLVGGKPMRASTMIATLRNQSSPVVEDFIDMIKANLRDF